MYSYKYKNLYFIVKLQIWLRLYGNCKWLNTYYLHCISFVYKLEDWGRVGIWIFFFKCLFFPIMLRFIKFEQVFKMFRYPLLFYAWTSQLLYKAVQEWCNTLHFRTDPTSPNWPVALIHQSGVFMPVSDSQFSKLLIRSHLTQIRSCLRWSEF